jgi:membrane associated rhomboid family serine protease
MQGNLEERRQRRHRLIQFLLACGFGGAAFVALWPHPENPKVPLLGGLLAGFGGSYAATWLWILVRYGRGAARSMRIG